MICEFFVCFCWSVKYNAQNINCIANKDTIAYLKKGFVLKSLNLKKKITMNEDHMMAEAYSIPINSRCRILETGNRGQVVYIGRVPEVG